MMLLHLLVVFCAVYSTTAAHFPLEELADPFAVIEPRDDSVNYRLPTSLKPINYVITLEPFFEPPFTFDGQILIEIEVVEDTSTITLHGNMLTVLQENIQVRLENNVENIVVNSLTYDTTTMFHTIGLAQEVKAGSTIHVEITYSGILNEANNGFYRASYEQDGVTKWFATTHFEPYRARQAFPCFDEPALKATFHIFIIRPESYNSISNMELLETTNLGSGRFKDSFSPSVKMSTYLVAFVVSEMTPEKLGNQAVYAPRDLIDDGRGKFAVETGIEVIKAIEDFTGIEYSLSKMFQVSIPDKDFSPGAMENWGLVTYKQQYLMYKEGKTTSSEKERIVSIIAHEFGHQWFGNLVSPSWWEYIWLNEGFATYFEYYAAFIVDPTMRMIDQFVTATLQYAFESDGLETTRPMSHPAVTPSEISSLFDRVAYDKSGSVIRMMEHFLTQPVFRRGLRNYLTAKQFDAASPVDLWSAMQQAIGEITPDLYLPATVEQIMETWNSQAGYPVVTVTRNQNGLLTFSQSRFLLNKATHDDTSKWIIPISVAIASNNFDFFNTKASYWLIAQTEESNIQVDEDDVVILNKKQTGYYRVNYDEDLWNLLIDYLNSDVFSKINVLNRAQLIDDAFALARSGRLDYDIPMRLSSYLIRETDYIPLYSFFRALTFLNNHLAGSDSASYGLFKRYVKELLQKAYKDLGNDATGDHTALKNRISIINWLCKFEDEACVQAMHNKLTVFEPLSSPVHPDLQAPVYCGGLWSITDTNQKWQRLYQWYQSDAIEDLERNRVLSALGCTSNTVFLNRLLSMAVDQAVSTFKLRPEDRTAAFSAVYTSSDIGLDVAFTYVIENFAYLKSGLSTGQIRTVVAGIASRVTTSEKLSQLQQFVDSQSTEDQNLYGSIFTSAISTIQSNIEWSDNNVPSIVSFLEQYYTDGTTTESPTDAPTEPTDHTTPSVETTTPGGAAFILASVPLLLGAIILNMLA